jgi:hypothetical protein
MEGAEEARERCTKALSEWKPRINEEFTTKPRGLDTWNRFDSMQKWIYDGFIMDLKASSQEIYL